jgi:tape measure domain-containing protein
MDCNPIPKDLAAEVLSAEDFNRLNEFAPRLVRTAAEGLGVSLGALRQKAEHGQLTSAVLAIGIRTSAMGDMPDRVHTDEAIVPKSAAGKTNASELFSKVEIVNDGLRRLCFVNGRQIGQVLKLETPRARDMLAGVVEISFLASEIVERQVSSDEFKALDSEVLVNGCSGGSAPAFDPWPEALALGREIIRLNTQIARLLDRWDGDGLPSQRA